MSFANFVYSQSSWLWAPRWRDLLVACLFATILVSPLTGSSALSQGSQQMYLSVSSDEEHYASVVREVSEGRWLHRNPYLFEEKQGVPNIYMWSEVFLGALFRVWPFGIAWFILFCKWVGVTASFVCLVKLSRRLFSASTSYPLWPYTAAAGFFVLPMFLGSSFFFRVLDGLRFQGAWTEGLGALRFVNPVITYILLLGWMCLLVKFLERPQRARAVVLGISLGLMAWFYVFFWMFSSVVMGLCCLWFAWKRRRSFFALSLLALVTSLCIAIPYMLSVRWQILHSALITLQPLPPREALSVSYAVMAVYGSFFALRAWRVYRERQDWGFSDGVVGIFVLASFLAANQHLVTRSTFQPHHLYFLIELPLAGWVAILFLREFVLGFSARLERIVAIGALIGITWLGLGVQLATARNVRADFVDRERLIPAFTWIKKQSYPFVVYADNRAAELVSMYTQADVYYALHATGYESTSQARRELAWFVSKRLSGLRDLNQIPPAFAHDRQEIGYRIFESQYWRDRCGSYGCFPDAYLQELIKKYETFLSQDFAHVWKTYRVDVVLWDEKQEPSWQLEQYPFLEQIWKERGVSIWRWRKPGASD